MRLFGPVQSSARSARVPIHAGLLQAIRDHRRLAAGVAIGLAVTLLAWALVPRDTTGAPVVVAARDIAAGATLSAADLRLARLPDEALPHEHFTDPTQLEGRVAAQNLPWALVLTPGAVAAPGSGHPQKDHVLVPVGIADEAYASVLQPGHRVRVYATADTGESRDSTLVPEALVTAVQRRGNGALGGTTTVITLSVPQDRAGGLAALSGAGIGFALLN